MQRLDQQNKSGYVLEIEIKQLEKKKHDLQFSIDNLNASKIAQFKQFYTEIEELKRKRTALIEEVGGLEKKKDLLEQALA